MTDEEFAKHWLYVRPERMHEGAVDAVACLSDDQQALARGQALCLDRWAIPPAQSR